MKILYHHRTRATDAQLVHIREIATAFRQLGHEVDMVSLVPTENVPQDPNRDAGEASWKRLVRRVPFGYDAVQLAYNLVGIPMIFRRLAFGGVDFLYERYSLFTFAGVIAARCFRKPIILEVNSPLSIEQERDRDIQSAALARWSERWICNAATKVIVVSTPLKRILEGLGVRPEKIVVMPNGVNRDHFRSTGDRQALRDELGLGDSVVVGFVGWFRNWHGLIALIESFHRHRLDQKDAKLLLIGDGPAMPELRSYVETHNLQESIRFAGPFPHQEIHRYLDVIDIAVQPAANEYCCPMKIIEYMALGKPIVAPRQDNITELMGEGVQGLLFEPGQIDDLARCLAQLIARPELRRDMGAAAYQTIEKSRLLWTHNASAVVEMARAVRSPHPVTATA